MNRLYYGDNLQVMRDCVLDESIDVIYLDPPFQSGVQYNTMFATSDSTSAQIRVFSDTWKWGPEAEGAYGDCIENPATPQATKKFMEAMYGYLGPSSMLAYLCMLAPRLVEMKRTLKSTGSIFLHCDPSASHSIKLLMDSVFGAGNFQNEIIWSYKRYTAEAGRLQRLHDVIFYYGKSDQVFFVPLWEAYGAKSGKADSHYKQDTDGRWYRIQKRAGKEPYKIYLREGGKRAGDVWDIPPINASSRERLGYPTQKPEALLERILSCCTKPGDVVMDPFAGCGTTVAVAQKMGLPWIGIDITVIATRVIQQRFQLWQERGVLSDVQYEIIGLPADLASAKDLAARDSYQFQAWAVGLIPKAAVTQGRTDDHGIDGVLTFRDKTHATRYGHAVISVKGTAVTSPTALRDLVGTMQRDKFDMGILVTLAKPSRNMLAEATAAGTYSWETVQEIPRVQIVTVGDLLNGDLPDLPPAGVRVDFQGARVRSRVAAEAEERERSEREDETEESRLF